MNNHGTADYIMLIPGGMLDDYGNLMYLYFISQEISLDNYIRQVQELYRNSL
jgi:hypothetical protein